MESTIPNNKPGIIICGKGEGTCMFIDVAIWGERNVIKKGAEKILKYKYFTTEVWNMWNVETKLKPVIIQATGTISKSFWKYLSNLPGSQETTKTAIFSTAHICQKVLM